jgi:hypothetical protein
VSKLLVWPPAVLLLVWPPAVAVSSATCCSCGRECCEDALGAASGTACVAPVVPLLIEPRTDLPGVAAGLLKWMPAKLLVWLTAKLLVWLPAKLLVLPPAVVPVVATAEEAHDHVADVADGGDDHRARRGCLRTRCSHWQGLQMWLAEGVWSSFRS